MYTDRPLLKGNARVIVKTAKPSLLTAAVIYLAVYALINYLSTRVLGVNITTEDAQRYMNYYMSGNYDALVSLADKLQPPASAYLLNMLLGFVMNIVEAGLVIFIFNTVKNAGAVFGNLLDGFAHAGRLILLFVLEGLFVFLWSLLLIVPGIIAAYRYRMALYLLLENPDLGVMDCLKTSSRMMKGHKWELFVLDLSFIGWYLLRAIPYLGWATMIWSEPYMKTTYVLYYLALSGRPVIVNAGGNANPYQ